MHIVVFILWIISLVVLALVPGQDRFVRNTWAWGGWGLFLFDLWLGLHFLIETSDRVTL